MVKLRLRDLYTCLCHTVRSLTEEENNYGTVKNEPGLDKWKLVMQNPKNLGRTKDLTMCNKDPLFVLKPGVGLYDENNDTKFHRHGPDRWVTSSNQKKTSR